MSLADWAAWYDACGKPYIQPSHELDIDNYPLETNADDNDDEYEENKTMQKVGKGRKPELSEVFVLTRMLIQGNITVN